jgi:hypothetical protein
MSNRIRSICRKWNALQNYNSKTKHATDGRETNERETNERETNERAKDEKAKKK